MRRGARRRRREDHVVIRHGVGKHLPGAARGAARRVVLLGGDRSGAVELLAQPAVDLVAMTIVFEGERAERFRNPGS